jgi:hypothetical protein
MEVLYGSIREQTASKTRRALAIRDAADRIDSEIEVAQCRVCEFLDLDRSALFQT